MTNRQGRDLLPPQVGVDSHNSPWRSWRNLQTDGEFLGILSSKYGCPVGTCVRYDRATGKFFICNQEQAEGITITIAFQGECAIVVQKL